MLTPEQAAAKWRARASVATDAIRNGVLAMTDADDPLRKAAAKENEWAEGVRRAAEQRRFSRGLARVTFQEWKDAMLNKGIANFQNGLKNGEVKMQRFLQSFLPWIQQGQAKLRSNPRGTLQQNIERSRIMIEHLANYRRDSGEVNLGGFGGGFR